MKFWIVCICLIPLVSGGYLPPPDYGNESGSDCACDDPRISSLVARVSTLEANAELARTRADVMNTKMELLSRRKRQAHSGVVAFTAYLSHYANGLMINQPVIYDKTLLNEGAAYDTVTGKFTAPSDGVYMFSMIIETKHQVDTTARLVVDGVNMFGAVVEPEHQEQNLQGGNVGVLKLRSGQQVWVQIYKTNFQALEGGDLNRFTTFTGVLLAETVTA